MQENWIKVESGKVINSADEKVSVKKILLKAGYPFLGTNGITGHYSEYKINWKTSTLF